MMDVCNENQGPRVNPKRPSKSVIFFLTLLTFILIFCVAMPLIISITSQKMTIQSVTVIPTSTTTSTSTTSTSSTSTSTTSTTTSTTSTSSTSTSTTSTSSTTTSTSSTSTSTTSTSSTTTSTTSTSSTSTTSTSTTSTSSTTTSTTSTSSTSTSTTSTSSTSTSTTSTSSTSTTSTSSTTTSTTSTSSTSTSTTSTSSTTTSTSSTSTSTTSTSSTSTTSTSSTTTQRPLVSIANSGDTIVALYSTTAGGSTGGYNGYYPTTQFPACATDNDITTKYLNFGATNCETCFSTTQGVGTGFFVIPAISNTTIARALLFATADDYPPRDPITVTLEGATTTNMTLLHQGSSWTLLYSGSTGIDGTVDPGRGVYVAQKNFSNITPYKSYRLLVTSQRGSANSVQYAESHIIGYV